MKLIDSSSSYAYDPRTRTFVQPEFSSETVKRFRDVNSQVFDELRTSEDIVLSARLTVSKGSTLTELARIASREETLAPVVLSAVMQELQKQKRCVVHRECFLILDVHTLCQVPCSSCS
jgi:small subunit ribosomal protein S29